jgi:hypothetical protein
MRLWPRSNKLVDLQLLEIARFIVHLDLEGVYFKQSSATLGLGLVIAVLRGGAVEVTNQLNTRLA